MPVVATTASLPLPGPEPDSPQPAPRTVRPPQRAERQKAVVQRGERLATVIELLNGCYPEVTFTPKETAVNGGVGARLASLVG